MTELEFEEFSCIRDDLALFAPLSFGMVGGEIAQIVGPNGAGKTTFLRSICGLFADWQGQLRWRGTPLAAPSYDFASELLYLGHQPGVKKSLTAKENLLWYFGIQGRAVEGELESALAKVGLSGYEDVPCFQMSAGQHRRVALARLYVTPSSIWILDEPFTAIDKAGVKNLETLLQEHASKGGIVILTTHQALHLEGVKLIELVPNKAGYHGQ